MLLKKTLIKDNINYVRILQKLSNQIEQENTNYNRHIPKTKKLKQKTKIKTTS